MSETGPLPRPDLESALEVLADIRDLIHGERLSAESRAAIDQAVRQAVSGSPELARDFVRNVLLGIIDPLA